MDSIGAKAVVAPRTAATHCQMGRQCKAISIIRSSVLQKTYLFDRFLDGVAQTERLHFMTTMAVFLPVFCYQNSRERGHCLSDRGRA